MFTRSSARVLCSFVFLAIPCAAFAAPAKVETGAAVKERRRFWNDAKSKSIRRPVADRIAVLMNAKDADGLWKFARASTNVTGARATVHRVGGSAFVLLALLSAGGLPGKDNEDFDALVERAAKRLARAANKRGLVVDPATYGAAYEQATCAWALAECADYLDSAPLRAKAKEVLTGLDSMRVGRGWGSRAMGSITCPATLWCAVARLEARLLLRDPNGAVAARRDLAGTVRLATSTFLSSKGHAWYLPGRGSSRPMAAVDLFVSERTGALEALILLADKRSRTEPKPTSQLKKLAVRVSKMNPLSAGPSAGHADYFYTMGAALSGDHPFGIKQLKATERSVPRRELLHMDKFGAWGLMLGRLYVVAAETIALTAPWRWK